MDGCHRYVASCDTWSSRPWSQGGTVRISFATLPPLSPTQDFFTVFCVMDPLCAHTFGAQRSVSLAVPQMLSTVFLLWGSISHLAWKSEELGWVGQWIPGIIMSLPLQHLSARIISSCHHTQLKKIYNIFINPFRIPCVHIICFDPIWPLLLQTPPPPKSTSPVLPLLSKHYVFFKK